MSKITLIVAVAVVGLLHAAPTTAQDIKLSVKSTITRSALDGGFSCGHINLEVQLASFTFSVSAGGKGVVRASFPSAKLQRVHGTGDCPETISVPAAELEIVTSHFSNGASPYSGRYFGAHVTSVGDYQRVSLRWCEAWRQDICGNSVHDRTDRVGVDLSGEDSVSHPGYRVIRYIQYLGPQHSSSLTLALGSSSALPSYIRTVKGAPTVGLMNDHPVNGSVVRVPLTATYSGAGTVAGKVVTFSIAPLAGSETATGHAGHTTAIRGYVDPIKPFGDPGAGVPYSDTGTCTTDNNGACSLKLLTPRVSATYEVTAAVDGVTPSVQQLKVGYPNFVSLAGNGCPAIGPLPAAATYCLTGDTVLHPSNHYGTAKLVDAIPLLAAAYRKRTGLAGALGINDMSLSTGGLFDSQGRYGERATAPKEFEGHVTHRTGLGVDINRTYFLTNGGKVPVNKKLLELTAKSMGFVPVDEPSIHFDLYRPTRSTVTPEFTRLALQANSSSTAALIAADVRASVVLAGGVFQYRYEAAASAQSTVPVDALSLDAVVAAGTATLSGAGLVPGTRMLTELSAWAAAQPDSIAAVPMTMEAPPLWAVMQSVDGRAEWTASQPDAEIAPGTTLAGFEVSSRGLPTLRSVTVSGYLDTDTLGLPIPESDEEQAAFDAAAAAARALRTTTLTTIGPTAPPSQLEALAFLDNLQGQLTQTTTLGWIPPASLQAELRAGITSARDAASAGRLSDARAALSTVLAVVTARSADMRPEAAALLRFNLQYLIDTPWTLAAAVAAVTPSALNFGATRSGTTLTGVTAAQSVIVTFTGSPSAWTAISNQPWLQITGGSGSTAGSFSASLVAGAVPLGSTSLSATITVTATTATNSPLTLPVTLTVAPSAMAAPFGSFDTPSNGATGLSGSFAVTGWALDDIGVQRVEIWRDLVTGETTPPDSRPGPGFGKVYIADAVFVAGSRPDVETTFNSFPLANRAGWGYLLMSWGLWNQGNGTYKLHAFAFDASGNTTTLGTKTITVNNAQAVKPFGGVDVPAYGETKSGSFYNFGWALTPNPNATDPRTCTITNGNVFVGIDSGALTAVNYGDARSDIAQFFPGFSNTSNPSGAYLLDTTLLTNGTHQIGWYVVDSCGRADGIGSRFFTVLNGATTVPAGVAVRAPMAGRQRFDSSEPLAVRKGDEAIRVYPNPSGHRVVTISQNERAEMQLPALESGSYTGYEKVNGERRALPLGSSLDVSAGVFYWQPAAGFLGPHDLEFVPSDGNGVVHVRAVVGTAVHTAIDQPREGIVSSSFVVAGWTIDQAATAGTGIDSVHVWAFPATGAAPIFLGQAVYGDLRHDISALFGDQFGGASYTLAVGHLASGTYDVVVYPHSAVTGDFHGAKVVRVTVP
jgi:hypothetical protein